MRLPAWFRWLRRLFPYRPSRPVLIVMRLEDMFMVHPDQDESRFCDRCRHRVGIYPSGQEALKRYPDCEIVCNRCNRGRAGEAASDTVLKEMHESVPREGSRWRPHE